MQKEKTQKATFQNQESQQFDYMSQEEKSLMSGPVMKAFGWLFKEENYHVFLRCASILLVFVHAQNWVLLHFAGLPSLARVNIISCMVYFLCIGLSFNRKNNFKVYVLICLEVMFYSMCMVSMLQNDCGYQMYCLGLLPFAYLTKYVIDIEYLEGRRTYKYRMLAPSVSVLVFVYFIALFVKDYGEKRFELHNVVVEQVLSGLNILAVLGCMLIGGGALAAVAVEYVAKTRSSLKEMERLKEDAEEANKSKSAFLANMSHEIRTPMNAICGMADLLNDEELSAQARDYTATIQSSGEHLLSIINDILDFSKIESNKMDITEDVYSTNALIMGVMSMIRIRVKDKPIQLIADVSDEVPKKFYGDKNRIRQIIINIMNNAVKFTDTGSVTLKVHFEQKLPEGVTESAEDLEQGGYLHFSVADTGRGIRAEDLPKLFDAFEQVDRQRNSGIEGTGLGLSICKLLTGMMGGRIWVESEYEKGSTFYFYIYQKIEDAAPCNFNKKKGSTSAKKSVQNFEVRDAKVLVVDDNRVNLKVAAGMLKRYGIIPVEVNSGVDAIEILKQDSSYDLVFMDHLMPDMDGIETTAHIRKINDRCRNELVIIALSANAVEGMEQQFLKADMNDFLSKPIENQKLGEQLKKWLPKEKIHDRNAEQGN